MNHHLNFRIKKSDEEKRKKGVEKTSEQIAADIAAFKAAGGRIERVPIGIGANGNAPIVSLTQRQRALK